MRIILTDKSIENSSIEIAVLNEICKYVNKIK